MSTPTKPRDTGRLGGATPPSVGWWAGALTGLVTAAVALAAGQLAAAVTAPASSPIVAVGQALIDLTPEWLKSFAIRTFGSHDKQVLLGGVYLVLAILAVVVGMAARRRRWIGLVGLGVLTAIGVGSALSRPTATPWWAVPSLVAGAAGLGAFVLLTAPGHGVPTEVEGGDAPADFDRRRFLVSAFALGAAAAASGGLSRFLEHRQLAEAGRASVRIPIPASQAGRLRPGTALDVPGISPFFTPNDQFYRVDTALLFPEIQLKDWRLQIHGMVDHPMTLTFEDLVHRPLIERDITLNCVSNPVGGGYIGNARWIGAALKPLLEEAGVQPGATQIASRSSDGMTIGTPTALALDGRDSMLAIAMNGAPLPFEHGFPVRMLVPGLYGYESATKWIVDIELTTLEAFQAYWVRRGWVQQVPVKTSSRIDTPSDGSGLSAGPVIVAGVAWAQDRGIAKVEVQVDAGDWHPATLAAQDTIDTWRQWTWEWRATPGDHTLTGRATDDTGVLQIGRPAPPFPSGATGYHSISVQVL